MSATLKCRSKNPNLCVDPNCPEKRNSFDQLAAEFDKRIHLLDSIAPSNSSQEALLWAGMTKDILSSPAPKTSAHQKTLQKELLADSRSVLNNYDDLSIVSQTGQQLTLADMGDPQLAQSNCWAVVSEIIENVSSSEFNSREIDFISLKNDDNYHAGVYVALSGQDFVVDYTARQFNPKLPFPLVATVENWEATITPYLGKDVIVLIGEPTDEYDEEAFDEAELSF
jgi:hypothetical protein